MTLVLPAPTPVVTPVAPPRPPAPSVRKPQSTAKKARAVTRNVAVAPLPEPLNLPAEWISQFNGEQFHTGIDTIGSTKDGSADTQKDLQEDLSPSLPADPEPPARQASFDPPPSARLNYDVTALRDGQNWYGEGTFLWQENGTSYSISGEAAIRILFRIVVLNFSSEGLINEFGIAPVQYRETPWRKETATTYFEHEEKTIRFSSSTASAVYHNGDQDRASLLWQLASIGRTEKERFTAGSGFDLTVAGARRTETWQVRVIGKEQVNTGGGVLEAWRVVRTAAPGSRDQTIEIWFAPELEWYPVKVRYTYPNGDHLDMSLSEVTPAALP